MKKWVLELALILSLSMPMTAKADARQYVKEITEQYGICTEMVEAMIETESTWNPKATNGDCIGLMQINKNVHKDRMERLGVTDLTDPRQNILTGVDLVAELFTQSEDPYYVLMVYNEGNCSRWEKGNYSYYATSIMERSAELERERGK